ncbi:MAG: sigma-70 family RNA polymerase sigma factor [Phycisphaerales bacterium]|nr:sigma-70 family RNA polymerase sigma factor [Phycisphaerales bacterium]
MTDPLPILDAKSVFEILVREHADMLTAYLRSLLGADPSVDDLFQQSMLVAWRRLGDYDRSRPFGPWLRGIAQRLVLEHHRKRLARPMSTDPQVLAELDTRFDELSRLSGDTFRERVDRLRECLSKLPDAMRHAIELVYARGLLIAAAAESLGAGEEAVKKRVQRGRQLLADCLISGTIDDAATTAEVRTP